jgi:hypothetical protein
MTRRAMALRKSRSAFSRRMTNSTHRVDEKEPPLISISSWHCLLQRGCEIAAVNANT